MTRRLDITNGDSAADALSKAGIVGKIIAWRDVLHEGPVDSSLSLSALSKQRARFIAERGWADLSRATSDFAERDEVIQNLAEFDEVVLWFEDDLYDQLQLIQLLDFFARAPMKGTKLSLVIVDGYIPPLSVAKLKQLDEARTTATTGQLELASWAWKAFGSDDPLSIVALLDGDTSALQYLAPALRRHLEEFPSVENGLSRSEYEALSAISEGHTTPVSAFLEVAERQESIFLGDTVFYWYLERLSGRTNALVMWSDGDDVVAPAPDAAREFVKRKLRLTPLGREVLAAREDWQALNPPPRWLGGVEISAGGKGWRWDESRGTLVRTGPPRGRPSAAPRKKKPSAPRKKTGARSTKRASPRKKKTKLRPAAPKTSRAPAKRSPRRKK